ncbi:MAG: glycoside hydrolase family 73 protein, partial [Bacteroidia bacterium]
MFLSVLSIILNISSFAQPSEKKNTPSDYIRMYKEDAISEMLAYGIPASITLAQGMLESGNGNSALSVYANNHFGIKCHAGWTGESYIMDDDAKNECFRKYEKVLDSYTDHSLFLKNRSRYAFLFELPLTDYRGWAKGLKEA